MTGMPEPLDEQGQILGQLLRACAALEAVPDPFPNDTYTIGDHVHLAAGILQGIIDMACHDMIDVMETSAYDEGYHAVAARFIDYGDITDDERHCATDAAFTTVRSSALARTALATDGLLINRGAHVHAGAARSAAIIAAASYRLIEHPEAEADDPHATQSITESAIVAIRVGASRFGMLARQEDAS